MTNGVSLLCVGGLTAGTRWFPSPNRPCLCGSCATSFCAPWDNAAVGCRVVAPFGAFPVTLEGFAANWGVSSHAEIMGRVIGSAHKCSSNQHTPIWRLTWKENNVLLFAQTYPRCFHVLYCMPNWSGGPKTYPKISPLPIPQTKQLILLSRQQTRRPAPYRSPPPSTPGATPLLFFNGPKNSAKVSLSTLSVSCICSPGVVRNLSPPLRSSSRSPIQSSE